MMSCDGELGTANVIASVKKCNTHYSVFLVVSRIEDRAVTSLVEIKLLSLWQIELLCL